MKRMLLVLLALSIVFTQAAGIVAGAVDGTVDEAVAEAGEESEVKVTVTFNGEELEFDVAPQIMNDRTMVPLRAIFEKMGAKVDWDDDTQTVTATKSDTVVVLVIDDRFPTINGEIIEIDQPGIIVNDRTLAPLRFVAEAFGGEVEWFEETSTASITTAYKGTEIGDDNVSAVEEDEGEDKGEAAVTKLLYQGHGSFRISAKDGTIVYVDPYAGDGYDAPADIVLVTHQHGDHNVISLITQKPDCVVIQNEEALKGGRHNSFDIGDIKIVAVTAENKNHNSEECVGYLITVDGIKIYAAGDTSKTSDMETFAALELDYALLPCDGIYNMGLEEAAECAELIGAKNNIPIHIKPGELFDRELAEQFNAPNKLIVEAGEEIILVTAN